ncbi:protein derived from transposon [Anaeramoeba flamelloides]|uniref:Protein derived from transposon n=1 Tax=Anaeramoeba flamelloides TaxID=1746091 RepID=A0ABQ8XHH1_9EUKA|nr:protein derived from transposon [Anaeramoeba flamelloides]
MNLKNNTDLSKYVSSSEFRNMKDKLEKAARLSIILENEKKLKIKDSEICKYFGVKQNSFLYRKKKYLKEKNVKKVGRPAKLLENEEELLKKFILKKCEQNKSPTIREVVCKANRIIKKNRLKNLQNYNPEDCILSHQWIYSWSKRNKIKLGNSSQIEKKRIEVSQIEVNRYWGLMKVLFEKYHYPPEFIFNMDETPICNDSNRLSMKVVCPNSIQKPKRNLEKSSFHISAVCCVSSDGSSLPTLIISKLKTIPSKLILQNHLVQLDFVQTNSGFIDKDIYYLWMLKTFIPFLEKTRNRLNSNHPALLTLDGHKSHFDVRTCELAIKHGIDIVCFPANGTHIYQPLDCGIFCSLKNHLKRQDIPKSFTHFVTNARDGMQVAFTFKNIISAFKHTGIYPLNPEKTGFSLEINNKSSVYTPSKRIHLGGTLLTQPEIVEKLKQREEKQTKKRIRHNQDN